MLYNNYSPPPILKYLGVLCIALLLAMFSPNQAFAQPANDLCADAILVPVPVVDWPSTNIGATDDGPITSCLILKPDGGADVWYKIVGTGQNFDFHMCSPFNTDTNLDLNAIVYNGTCGALTNTSCMVDDGCFLRPNVGIYPTVLGETYYIQVFGVGGATGDYFIDAFFTDPPPPSNNNCTSAYTVTCPSTSSGSTVYATLDGPATTCSGGTVAPDIWYNIVGTGGNITASLCGAGTDYDTKIDVYTGDCGSLTCVGGNDDYCAQNGASEFTWLSTLGTTYRIRVHGFNGATGNFTLNMTCADPAPMLTCPTNTTTAACQEQADVNTAFAAWLASASASGGCNGVLTNNNTGAPSACGGSTTVMFTYTSTCAPFTTTCQATFTVAAPPPVVFTCPTNTTVAACQTQAAVNSAFEIWLTSASGSGGCNGVWLNNSTGAPSACGGSTTVTFTYYSNCAPLTTSCQATFTVAAPPTVMLTCPTSTTAAACQTQADVNSAFATWLASATASGGCNGVLTNNNTGAPSACGGSTTVTFTYTSTCAPLTTTCQATFTVAAPQTVLLTCPTNTTAAACQTQAAVNTAFATWLASASASGGCNGVLTNNNTGAPSACGGSTTVTFTYTSSCAPTTTTCQATFTVAAPPTVLLTCPIPTTASACLTQAQLDVAYNAWLASATASGGCGGTLTNNSASLGGTPSICSATAVTRTVTFTYTSSCAPTTTTCTSTFTVPAYPTFTPPANGSATVACLANATQPTPPAVVDACGKALTPIGPTITNVPNPITCEGTRTYAWTYTDCSGLVRTWSFVYTIERQPFTVPANGAAQVACPANATQPTPPTVASNCGETLTPTGPVITNVPSTITCEGTRTYAWTYTDCEGNTAVWSFVYTIEREPFTAPANGGATVDCPNDTDVQPTPPVVTSNCGEVLTPVMTVGAKPLCEGTRTYNFVYTDCEGNTATWRFTYTIEYEPFVIPVSVVGHVECPSNAFQPTPPTVFDNCGVLLTPVGPTTTSTPNAQGCEGSRKYAWVYTDCEGNSREWSQTFLFDYSADFAAPLDEVGQVTCLAYAVEPVPQQLFDFCGLPIRATLVGVTQDIAAGGCTGWRKYSFVYTDCGGHSHPWNFTYEINDNEGPLGTCPSGNVSGGSSPVSVNVTNLACIGDVPCPDDYDFMPKVEELLEAGNYFDVCDGANVIVTLESWSEPWECSDPDGDGEYTFGRTFYFRIADKCGNEYPSLCEVTYSGECQPIESFRASDWGMAGGAPGTAEGTTDMQLIASLLSTNNPVVVGGSSRSLTINDAQSVVDLLPGIGGPSRLANCQQTNSAGCNPMGMGGMKNDLAANAIALTLNMRFSMQYRGLSMANVRNQRLECLPIHECIIDCDASGDCKLHIFDAAGAEHGFPHTIGGLLDLANLYLGGNINMSVGQSVIYGTGLNESLITVNEYWMKGHGERIVCAGSDLTQLGDQKFAFQGGNTAGSSQSLDFVLAPNPAAHNFNLQIMGANAENEVEMEVYNAFGQLVLRKDFGVVDQVSELVDVSALGNGLYIVSVKAGGEHLEQKLVIARN